MKSVVFKFVIVTPVYEDQIASNKLFKELSAAFGSSVYVVCVDDGSINMPVSPTSLTDVGLNGVVIKLKCNVGHQRAIATGLNYVADYLPDIKKIVVMDSDGEDSPASINTLVEMLENKDVDVAVAQRKRRVESLRFKMFYSFYKGLFYLFTGHQLSFGNFMALKNDAVRRLISMPELWLHLAGAVLISRLRICYCPTNRAARYAGESKMNFTGLALHGFKSLMVFVENVLVRVSFFCALVAFISIASSVVAVALKISGITTPGWLTVVVGFSSLMFVQTGVLTLMSLMLAGILKGGDPNKVNYAYFIESVFLSK